jgi:hypothetical protein
VNKEEFKIKLQNLFKTGSDWESGLDDIAYGSNDKRELIWAANDLAKEGYVSEAFKIAKYYAFAVDEEDMEQHELIESDEDVRYITSVRGGVCWLLATIVTKLETSYYSEILDLLEGKDSDSEDLKKLRLATGDNLYIRLQATRPLEVLAANMKAIKNTDGTPFDFGERNMQRTEALAFKMLDQNKNYPRVLEGLTTVFNRMRYLKEVEAMNVLETFFYKESEGGKKLNPEYVLAQVDVLAIFYAEFRNQNDDTFKSYTFVSFLKRIITEGDSQLLTSIVWHFWQAIKENKEYFKKFEKYLPLVFKSKFNSSVVSQIDFLIETIIDTFPKEGVLLFEEVLSYVENGIEEKQSVHTFLAYSEEILPKVLKIEPSMFSTYLGSLYKIWLKGVYIGEPTVVLTLYKQAPAEYSEDIKRVSKMIYEHMKQRNSYISDIQWE